MKSKVSIIIGGLVILIGGTYFALAPSDIIEPQDISQVEFQAEDISVKRENVEITTSTDQFGNVIKIGIRIPIKYNFPVATSTGYIVQEVEEYVEMNFDGFTMCRFKGKTKNQCLKELRDDIEATLEARQENIARELEELKRGQFQSEITEEDL
ncbi:hypothetical protein LCGC14_1089230 [marine sediment metagenome]|uniref:Uncharacterized protein n=1 Tax=marine sediment metagenome TaxID=412755 RepID=A0A0F9N0J0_9ZZZZ